MKRKIIFISITLALVLAFFDVVRADPPSGSSNANMSVKVVDHVAPANVSNFAAVPGDSHISLSWTNPPDADVAGVKILRKTTYYPTNPTDGDTVYDGINTAYVDLNLANDTQYFYTAFAYDLSGNYASGAIASAVPKAPSVNPTLEEAGKVVLPAEVANLGQKPTEAEKKDQLSLENFGFYVMFEGKPLQINLNQGKLQLVEGQTLLMTIPADIFTKKVNVITLTLGNSSYLFKLNQTENRYEAIITLPPTKGDYQLNIIIVYTDNTVQNIQSTALIDPAGYVYVKKSWPFNLGEKGEQRISGAEVTLYYQKGNQWQKWKAEEFNQKNSLITDSTGQFSFMVQNGKYYLEAKKSGYRSHKTDPFEVSNQIVNINIGLSSKQTLWYWFGAFALLLVVVVFVLRKKKRLPN